MIASLTVVGAVIAGCGGVLDASIGGSVTGLSGGTTVGLVDNGSDPLTVSANGNFTFATQVSAGNNYNVTVASQPVGETCTVTNGSGTVSQNHGDVTNVAVACNATVSATNDVLGTLSGLATGKTLTLLDNGTDKLVVNANGSFVFPTALAVGAAYSVTVSVQPSGQTCTITNGAGTIPSSGTILPVAVTCQ
ncbi:MAG TPA: hypothetical protein VIF60_16095 [Burkholderiaceae bacterium]